MKLSKEEITIIGMLLGAMFVTVAFITDNVFYAVVGVCLFILIFAGELDIYLSRRAGRDPNKDYILCETELKNDETQ